MATASLPDDVVPLVPMRNAVLFPHSAMPVGVGRPKSVAALRQAAQTGGLLGIVLQHDPKVDDPGRADLCDVGTLAQVLQQAEGAESQLHAMCQGVQRFRIEALVEGFPFLAARITRIEEPAELSPEAEALGLQLHQRAAEILALLPSVPVEVAQALASLRDPRRLADVVSHLIDSEVVDKQKLLETVRIEERMARLLELLARRIQVLRLSHEIGERTKEQLDDRQRKYLLREQLKTIQKELGEDDGQREDLTQLAEAIGKAGMPEEVRRHVDKELERLRRLGEGSSESALLRTWLEWMAELPWAAPSPPAIDLDAAKRILEDDHHGLQAVKRRIVEYLAVLKLNPAGRAPILCFVGPPGVGKTSLGQSIARALGRPFVRVSLGGVHDEAEIRGHRRTYVGALPGTIIQGIRKAGARHCVMMLDEVDKLSASFQGDPSAALLEVLDPEQNSTFRDNYLGVPFDLSRVVFIATANVLEQISLPVRDRMEVIELPGYTQDEKVAIARRYLVTRQREACGLGADQVALSDDALDTVVAQYTREAGVRQLEREIGRLMRHAAVRVAAGTAEPVPVAIGAAQLEDILGAPRFEHETALRSALPGVATGLAWTPVGGDILFVEATRVAGSGRLILTGQLGDVMKESAQAALTLVKSCAPALGIAAAMFEGIDVHLHVPAGAIPKDGPSAGVAMFMALASLFTDRSIRPEVAMTGEISLRGLVLPVGGIKEKVLAAQRAGVRCVLLPARNRKDLRDIPASTQQQLEFVWLEQVDDALRVALSAGAPPRSLQLA
ncbi:MAG: endopeptidase La [Burkholderiaceae bacterium]|nr:endopeptidase La [Burkholderiaceae bacterium]